MRRGRGRRGSSAKRRSVDWYHAEFHGLNIQFGSVTGEELTGSFWALYPASIPDPLNEDFAREPDCTLVRTFSTLVLSTKNNDAGNDQVQEPVRAAAGLIAWDSIDPVDNILSDQFPNPLDGSHDWLWRDVFCSNFTNTINAGPGDYLFQNSKGQRKLPKNTGVLACVSCEFPDSGLTIEPLTVDWMWDIRFLVKKAP